MNEELAKEERHELIESKIFICRDMPVMLDNDVADFFGIEIKIDFLKISVFN